MAKHFWSNCCLTRNHLNIDSHRKKPSTDWGKFDWTFLKFTNRLSGACIAEWSSHSTLNIGMLWHTMGWKYVAQWWQTLYQDPSTKSTLFSWFYLIYLIQYYIWMSSLSLNCETNSQVWQVKDPLLYWIGPWNHRDICNETSCCCCLIRRLRANRRNRWRQPLWRLNDVRMTSEQRSNDAWSKYTS